MKQKFKIIDQMFAHAKYSTDFQDSEFIEWYRNTVNPNDIVFFTDYSLDQAYLYKNKNKIAWLLESPEKSFRGLRSRKT